MPQWLMASVLRTQDVQQLRDGLPGALCAMLASWQSEWSQGVPLDLGDGPRLHFIDKICVLADAEGLRAVTGTKGASGTKPCLRCENVLSHAFAAQSVHLEDHTYIAETDFGKCKLLTQTRLMQFLNYMDEADTVKSLEDAETLLGWNHRRTRAGFLCAESLQNLISIESCHFDSMHIYFSNGLICQEVGYWWTRLQETSNVRIEALYKTTWRQVGQLARQAAVLFWVYSKIAMEKRPGLSWQCGSVHGSSSTCLSLSRRSASWPLASHGKRIYIFASVSKCCLEGAKVQKTSPC